MKTLRSIFPVLLAAVLSMASLTASADGNDTPALRLRVINQASSPIDHLYVSDVNRGDGGQDALGLHSVIEVDRFADFVMDHSSGQCIYDIKAVLKDGRFSIRRNFNLCNNDRWTVTD